MPTSKADAVKQLELQQAEKQAVATWCDPLTPGSISEYDVSHDSDAIFQVQRASCAPVHKLCQPYVAYKFIKERQRVGGCAIVRSSKWKQCCLAAHTRHCLL